MNLSGLKEVLGSWAADNEGAKFWMPIVTELKNRGVTAIFMACVEGLKGLPEAIEAIDPNRQVQLCIVHLVRHSLSYVWQRERKEGANDLKTIYPAVTLGEAAHQFTEFEERWEASSPVMARSWRLNWSRIVPIFGDPSEIRRVSYRTNTIASLKMTLRKVTKNRPLFTNDEAEFKLMYLALRKISPRWTMPIKHWSGAMNQLAILFEGRVPMAGLSQNSLT